MRVLGRVVLVSLLAAAMSRDAARAQSGAVSLPELARAWSGTADPPRCTADGQQQRDGIPGFLAMRNCVWPPQVRGRGVLRVSAVRTPIGTIGLLTREEDVPDRAAAIRMRDSLSATLRAQGFEEVRCYTDDRQWRSRHGAIHFSIGAVFPNGLLRVGVFATGDRRNIPAIACPDSSQSR